MHAVSAGKIHLLDLGALKAQFGPKWDRMAEHVQLFFEAAIRRALGPGDSFCRSEGLNYLLLFHDLLPEEAAVKCMAISEEVCCRLFGENGVGVALRNLTAPIPFAPALDSPQQSAALDMLLERHGKEQIVTRGSPADASEAAERPVRFTASTQPGKRQLVCLRDVGFCYRPIWDLVNNAVLTYLCQPTGPSLASDFWTAEDEEEQIRLDLHLLRECAGRANQLRAAGSRLILAVPVHFSTVSRPRSWRVYDELLKLSGQTRRDIAFMVFGIDHGVPHVRLVQELPKLSRMSYRVFCVVDRCSGAGGRFAKTGAHGIGIAVGDDEDEVATGDRLRKLGDEARTARLDAFTLGIASTSLVLMSAHAGIRYLEGPVVRSQVDDPRHGFAQGLEDIYRLKRQAV
jgi:hypothetical protein